MNITWTFEHSDWPKANDLAHALAQTIGPDVIKTFVEALAHSIITHNLQHTYRQELLPFISKGGLRVEHILDTGESMLVVIHARRAIDHILSLLPAAIEEQEANFNN